MTMYNSTYMSSGSRLIFTSTLLSFLLLNACSDNQDDSQPVSSSFSSNQDSISNTEPNPEVLNTDTTNLIDYPLLQKKIMSGSALLFDVKQALTETDVGSLTNTMHGLYAMRWHRGVYNLLDDMWKLDKKEHPDFAWELLEKPPVRIALASTINRIKIINTDEQLEYIRNHKNDEHEFHRAQVVVALGMNGEAGDIDYIKTMAMSDNPYVAQSALSGLALMGGDKAKHALAEVWKEFKDTKRGDLAEQLIQKVYNVSPTLEKPEPLTGNESQDE